MHTPSALFAPDRLAALSKRNLLGAPADPVLDRVTNFITRVLDAPIALLTLVYPDRQFFLSQCGLAGPIAEARQTSITHSFCQYVVTHGEPFVVNDARVHPLVQDNPATKELPVIAYAGAPLVTSDGKILGALSAIDFKPRQWKPEDVDLLGALAAHAITKLELQAKTAELGAKIRTHRRNDAERLSAARLTVHDLRTPLTGLLLSLEMLPQMGALSIDQTELISLCVRTGGALRKLVDDLLEIHEHKRGGLLALQKTSMDPLRLADQAIEQVRSLAAEKSIELTPVISDHLRKVDVDDAKFTRVLVNLLANAIKFTPHGGRVALTLFQTGDRARSAIIFRVQDTGIGIRTSDARRIFGEGVRLNEAATVRESSGLGLTYCKRVIEAHGGSIWLESQPGSGSTFFVRIPTKNPLAAKKQCLAKE